MTPVEGLTAPLWPVRYKPFPDELLSCWLVRLAHGHGLRVQTFCNLLFGNRKQVWNRDIDRLAPEWLIEALALHTGTPLSIANATTLRVFEGVLYPRFRSAGHLQWVQTLKMYHRKRTGYGQQYCPACLGEDTIPYFRKMWRLSIITTCLKHNCMLHDRCPQCQAPVSFHRTEMGKSGDTWSDSLAACHVCGANLADAEQQAPSKVSIGSDEILRSMQSQLIEVSHTQQGSFDSGQAAVLRHMTALMLSRKRKLKLRQYLADRFDMPDLDVQNSERPSIEGQSMLTRHTLLAWSAWLLESPAERLGEACRAGAMLYNHAFRDLRDPPRWFIEDVVPALPKRAAAGKGKRTSESRAGRRRSTRDSSSA